MSWIYIYIYIYICIHTQYLSYMDEVRAERQKKYVEEKEARDKEYVYIYIYIVNYTRTSHVFMRVYSEPARGNS